MKLTDRFSEMGIASLLAGMRYAHDRLGEEIKVLEQTLEAHHQMREEGLRQVAREISEEFGFGPKRRGRPPGAKHSGWAKMTAAQRSEEMRRRQAVAAKRKAAGLGHVRQPKGVSWAGMTAEQRSIEMKRRQAVARQKLLASAGVEKRGRGHAGANHPRDARHPDHAAWLAKLSKANKKRWASMSDTDRKKRIKRMVAGGKAAHQEVKEALVNGAAQ